MFERDWTVVIACESMHGVKLGAHFGKLNVNLSENFRENYIYSR